MCIKLKELKKNVEIKTREEKSRRLKLYFNQI